MSSLLYKYYSPERLSVLDNLQVRFTRLSDLNDPYEGRFQLGARPDEKVAAETDDYSAEKAEVEVFVRSTLGVLGVFCCGTDPASEVMWAHYAGEHRGFVIGLNRALAPFKGQAFIWSSYGTKIDLSKMRGFGTFREVEYVDEPFSIPFGGNTPLDALFRKKTKWSYEQEVRIFRSLFDADRVIDKQIHLFSIPARAGDDHRRGKCR